MLENKENQGGNAVADSSSFIFRTLVDTKLIEGCIRNDKSSQKAFYSRYSPVIMGICCRYSSSEKVAVPMSVFVFRELFSELRDIPKDVDLKQWISSKAIWSAIKYLHQDKHTFFIAKTTRYEENKPVFEEIDEDVLTPEACRVIYLSALQSLTPSYRILYNLTYIDELPPDDIINKLQIAAATYKAELEQARYQFKKQLNVCNHEYKQHGGRN